jgi:hypothetical protein
MQNLLTLAFVIPSQVTLASLGEHAFTLWATAKKAKLSLSVKAGVLLNNIASKTPEKWLNFFG